MYLEVEKELETTENQDKDEIFYRYRIGRYVIWFTQYQDNGKKSKHQNCVGCIFQVHIESDDPKDLHLRAGRKIGSDLSYPDEFFIDNISQSVLLEDFDGFKDRLYYANECLWKIKEFLYQGPHYELFKKREGLK